MGLSEEEIAVNFERGLLTMKKLIAAILLACTAITLVACCDVCNGFTTNSEILGAKICDDCMNDALGSIGW